MKALINEQRLLWVRSTPKREKELCALHALLEERKFILPSHTTGFLRIETVSDAIDAITLGRTEKIEVSFEPCVGVLSGFSKPVVLRMLRGENTIESKVRGQDGFIWTIKVTNNSLVDLVKMLLSDKIRIDTLILDCTEISEGDEASLMALVTILNIKACSLLTRQDIIDIIRLLGKQPATVVIPFGDPEWVPFAKSGFSENALIYYHRPSEPEIGDIFKLDAAPQIINGSEAIRRAPWFKGVSGAFLHGNKSLCRLTQIDASKFNRDFEGLCAAARFAARASYRLTLTLGATPARIQATWQEQNDYLRLCGVELIGVTDWEHKGSSLYRKQLRNIVILGAHSMADELQLPRSQLVTSVAIDGGGSPLSAVAQLDRYIAWLHEYATHNVRTVITYRSDEITAIQKWLWRNWDNYLGVRFVKIP